MKQVILLIALLVAFFAVSESRLRCRIRAPRLRCRAGAPRLLSRRRCCQVGTNFPALPASLPLSAPLPPVAPFPIAPLPQAPAPVAPVAPLPAPIPLPESAPLPIAPAPLPESPAPAPAVPANWPASYASALPASYASALPASYAPAPASYAPALPASYAHAAYPANYYAQSAQYPASYISPAAYPAGYSDSAPIPATLSSSYAAAYAAPEVQQPEANYANYPVSYANLGLSGSQYQWAPGSNLGAAWAAQPNAANIVPLGSEGFGFGAGVGAGLEAAAGLPQAPAALAGQQLPIQSSGLFPQPQQPTRLPGPHNFNIRNLRPGGPVVQPTSTFAGVGTRGLTRGDRISAGINPAPIPGIRSSTNIAEESL